MNRHPPSLERNIAFPKILLSIFLAICSVSSLRAETAESKFASNNADFFVAIDGNDQWSGRLPQPNATKTDGPLGTLARARDKVRERLRGMDKNDIRVLIRGGTYVLADSVVFGPEDSAPDGRHIVYAAFPGEKPVFSSDVSIGPWKKLSPDDEPAGLPAIASGHVWMASSPTIPYRFKALYTGAVELPRARSRGFDPLQKYDDATASRNKLRFPPGSIKNWENLQDAELLIRPAWPWLFDILAFASVDVPAGLAITSQNGSSKLTQMTWLPPPEKNSAWIENVVEALDGPGEWVLNSSKHVLYLWPTEPGSPHDIFAPTLTEYILLAGDEQTGQPVRNIVLEGLTFTQAERDTRSEQDIPLEQGWELYDKANAMVRLRCTERCVVRHCTFTTSAASGLRLDLRAVANIVDGNRFEYLGGSGILLSGYGPGTTDLNKQNEVVNNVIHHIGRHFWQSPGIMITQSSANRIAHNLVYHVPYTAIMIAGLDSSYFRSDSTYIRWKEIGALPDTKPATILPYFYTHDNIVELNEVHHAMERLGDGNGIYVWLSPHGNIIRQNYVHHILSPGSTGAIRCDDYQSGVEIRENIVYQCANVGIAIKMPNRICNNIIADIVPKLSTDPSVFGYIQLSPNVDSVTGRLTDTAICQGSDLQKNIFYNSGAYVDFWADKYNNLKDCHSDDSVYYCLQDPARSRAYLAELQTKGTDSVSVSSDPMFMDIANGDFRLRPDSPALQRGFKPIDMSKIGPTSRLLKKSVTD